jgi:tetratricopeptide (TPR) repeat protein
MTRSLLLAAVLLLALAGGFGVWFSGSAVSSSPAVTSAPETLAASPLAARAEALVLEGRAPAARQLLAADEDTTLEQLPAGALLVELTRHLVSGAEAAELGERLVDRWPDRSEAQLAYAKALGTYLQESKLAALFKLGTYKHAAAEAVRLDPGNIDARVNQIGFLVYAPSLVGGDKQAARELSQALVADDEAAGAMMLALTYDHGGDKPTARQIAQDAAVNHPDHQDLLVVLASLQEETGRHGEAMATAGRVLEGPRGRPYFQALYQLARLELDRSMDPALALARLDEYLAYVPPADFLPPEAFVVRRRGQALQRLGRVDEARAAYERALELEPEFDQARQDLERLDRGLDQD